jgi:hypothetical protein
MASVFKSMFKGLPIISHDLLTNQSIKLGDLSSSKLYVHSQIWVQANLQPLKKSGGTFIILINCL